jgi:glucose-1-phosphate thymidylyltransferase
MLPIAGKPIVQRLVEDIVALCNEKVDHIGFVIGDFGEEVENQLKEIASGVGAEGHIYFQEVALGTAHAILCAQDLLQGNVIVAFADTLFKADFNLDQSKDGVIWVQQVEDPRPFGVVKVNEDNTITEFVEKPEDFVSDLAIIGIYYFKDGAYLKQELQYLIDHNIKDKGEFQITNALDNMKNKGAVLTPGTVQEWLDCGNKDVTVSTNRRYLEFIKDQQLVSDSAKIENSVIIPPVYIGENAEIRNSVVGPHVSVGEGTLISDSRMENCIVQNHSEIAFAQCFNTMIGNHARYKGSRKDLSIGDFSVIKE